MNAVSETCSPRFLYDAAKGPVKQSPTAVLEDLRIMTGSDTCGPRMKQ